MQSPEPEQQFLLRELWTLAWAASVQRANLYALGSRQTGQLRDMLQEFITTRILPHYVGSCTERQHYLNLAQLVEFGTGALPGSLRDGRYEKPLRLIDTPEALQEALRNALKQFIGLDFLEIDKTRFRVAFPVPDKAMHSNLESGPEEPDWHADNGLRDRIGTDKRITIVAVIDDGLPFAHRHFRDASGKRSRVEFCWLQSVDAEEQQRSVLFGREYTRAQIEDHIDRHGNDEDTLYREAGASADSEDFGSLIDRHATHGGHVMDLATGYAPEYCEDPAEEIRIIAVQLPNTIAWDTSGFGKDMYMLSAFHYIFNRADMIADGYGIDRARLVINFSYGFSGGRHDGGTELEAAIDEMICARRKLVGPTALVLPAGNTFLDRLHAQVREADFKDDTATLRWRVQPNDRTPSYLELWFPEGMDISRYAIELRDPTDRLISSLPVRPEQGIKRDDLMHETPVRNDKGDPIGQVSADKHRGERWRVLVVLAPTEPELPGLPGAEAGKWSINIRREATAPRLEQPIHGWIQRSADPENLRSGSRQSYFADHRDVRYNLQGDLSEVDVEDANIRRLGSLNGLATAKSSLIVAGYRLGAGLCSSRDEALAALYSSAGCLHSGWPDAGVACSSMSDRSRVLRGTIAAGVRSGAVSIVQGTSTAAPFVVRQLATIFVTADDDVVERASEKNYLPLLSDLFGETTGDDATVARLGTVRVPPHRQPGVDTCRPEAQTDVETI
ncbi:hypothetical protein ACVME8_008773 [Bradyrhizobium diazoefficiens]